MEQAPVAAASRAVQATVRDGTQPPDQSMKSVTIRGLHKSYGDQHALRGIDLEFREGEIFGLLGPNGAGKTTLVYILATLRSFDEGAVTVCSYALPKKSQQVRESVGIVPQELAVYDEFTARRNLLYFGGLYGIPSKTLKERIAQALQLVGLTDHADKRVATFSGGMKRRLNLAAGLLHRPRLLLLDEPTVGVDPQSRHRIFEAIRQLSREVGMTILYTTHYMEEAEDLCDRLAILDHGTLVACDTVPALLRSLGPAVVRIEFEESMPLAESRLLAQPCFSSVSTADGVLQVGTEQPEEALRALLEFARQDGLHIRDIQVRPPSLQELFLQLTGSDLRD